MALKPRTPLQLRDAAVKPIIPRSRRVVVSSGQTSFLNKTVENLANNEGEKLAEKITEMMRPTYLERRITGSEPRSPKDDRSISTKVD